MDLKLHTKRQCIERLQIPSRQKYAQTHENPSQFTKQDFLKYLLKMK